MADNVTVPTSGGTATLATHDVGGGVHKQKVEVSGDQPASTTGTSTTAASTVPAAVTNYGNATITISGTYAGVSIIFEVSDDGGTTYYALQAQRESDGAVFSTDTLATNASIAYLVDCPGVTHLRVRATAWTSGTANVRISPGGMVAVPVVSVGNTGGATGGTSSVTGAATATTLKAANNARRGLTLFNDSASSCFVLLGAGTVSSTVFTVKMAPGAYYEVPFGFTGPVSGNWVTATGSMRVTEMTA
jgi:hypothetical protein